MKGKKIFIRGLKISVLTLSLVSAALYANEVRKSYDTVNESIVVTSGEKADEINSVNGNIEVGKQAVVGDVESVNGDISLAEKATAKSIDSVNGDVEADNNVTIEKNITTVNGEISFAKGSHIKGSINSVNGDIELSGVTLEGDIEVTSSDVILKKGTVINGNLIVKKNKNASSFFGLFSSSSGSKPKIKIGDNVVIKGQIIFNRKVKLDVSDSAKIPEIKYGYKK